MARGEGPVIRGRIWLLGAYFAAFYLLQTLARLLRLPEGTSIWFPPPALTLALVLGVDRRLAWAAFLAPIPHGLSYLPGGGSLLPALGVAFAHGAAYGLGAWWVRRRGAGPTLERFHDLRAFLLLALGSVTAAALLVGGVLALNQPGAGDFLARARNLWIGDALGVLALAPFLLLWGVPLLQGEARREEAPDALRAFELLLQGFTVVAVAFLAVLTPVGQSFPYKYLGTFPLVWIALRWGAKGAALGNLCFTLVVAATFLAMGYPITLLGEIQTFLLVTLTLTLLIGTQVSTRRRAQRALRRQAVQFASVLRATGAVPFELDRSTGATLDVSPGLDGVLGITQAQWHEKPWWGALLMPREQEALRRFFDGQTPGRLNLRMRGRDLQVVAGIQAGPTHSGILLDITDQRAAERRLAASEALYRTTVESLEEGVVVRDPGGRARFINAGAQRIFGGIGAGEEPRDHLEGLVDEGGGPVTWEEQPAMKALRWREPFAGTFGILNSNGERRWLGVRSRPIWEGSELQGVVSTLVDITEERKATEALRSSEARYRSLVEQSLVPMAIIQEGRFVFLNAATLDLLGAQSASQLLGTPALDVLLEEERAAFAAHLRAQEAGGGPGTPSVEHRVRRLDGAIRTVEIVTLAAQYEGRPALQGMAVDITDRKAMEQTLQENLRNKELSIREIHHRVKNNLQVVSSLLRLQAGTSGLPAVQAALLEAQERIQAIALVHQKLHQAPSLAEADLQDYVQKLVQQLVRSYAASPTLVDLGVSVAPMRLGPDDLVPLALVLHELALNALRHGFPEGRGGSLRVELRPLDGGRALLRVEDDGLGLPDDLDPLTGGGLGFQLVRALADQLRGSFEVERRRGAAFRLTFTPRTPDLP